MYSSFGEFGHERVLISLTVDDSSIRIALDRLQRLAPGRGKLKGWIRQRRERSK